jgi:hypothetical protein
MKIVQYLQGKYYNIMLESDNDADAMLAIRRIRELRWDAALPVLSRIVRIEIVEKGVIIEMNGEIVVESGRRYERCSELMKCISSMGQPCIKYLLEMVADSEPGMRYAACEALSRLRGVTRDYSRAPAVFAVNRTVSGVKSACSRTPNA